MGWHGQRPSSCLFSGHKTCSKNAHAAWQKKLEEPQGGLEDTMLYAGMQDKALFINDMIWHRRSVA
jgi:hypothetical protein